MFNNIAVVRIVYDDDKEEMGKKKKKKQHSNTVMQTTTKKTKLGTHFMRLPVNTGPRTLPRFKS